MKKYFLFLFLAFSLLAPLPMEAQTVSVSDYKAADYETITVSTTALGVTDAKISTGGVFVTIETANIRFRFDGTAPTATEGHLLYAGQSLLLRNATAARKLKMIRDTGSAVDAVAKVSHLQN